MIRGELTVAPAVQGGHSRGASGGDHGGLYRRGAGRPGCGGGRHVRVPGLRQERGLAPSPGSVPRGPAPAGGLSGAYEF